MESSHKYKLNTDLRLLSAEFWLDVEVMYTAISGHALAISSQVWTFNVFSSKLDFPGRSLLISRWNVVICLYLSILKVAAAPKESFKNLFYAGESLSGWGGGYYEHLQGKSAHDSCPQPNMEQIRSDPSWLRPVLTIMTINTITKIQDLLFLNTTRDWSFIHVDVLISIS